MSTFIEKWPRLLIEEKRHSTISFFFDEQTMYFCPHSREIMGKNYEEGYDFSLGIHFAEFHL